MRFDYAGALRVARRLWALASSLDSLRSTRGTASEEALVDWLGAYGDEFRARIGAEASTATSISSQLREG
ncbi:MAG: hypothetical protein ACK5OX_18885, partial [Desertimonas sp.]